jgi:hypothetical protein
MKLVPDPRQVLGGEPEVGDEVLDAVGHAGDHDRMGALGIEPDATRLDRRCHLVSAAPSGTSTRRSGWQRRYSTARYCTVVGARIRDPGRRSATPAPGKRAHPGQ